MKINVCVKKIKFEELTESNVFGRGLGEEVSGGVEEN
jgi:hypothetical protein